MAINNEVLVAICNQNYAGHGNMLETWLTNVQRAGVKNAMVVALDAFTRDYVEAQGMAAYEMHLEAGLLIFCFHNLQKKMKLIPIQPSRVDQAAVLLHITQHH